MMLVLLAIFLVMMIIGTVIEKKRVKANKPSEEVSEVRPEMPAREAQPVPAEKVKPVQKAPVQISRPDAPEAVRVTVARRTVQTAPAAPAAVSETEEKLSEIDRLLASGRITRREYKKLRRKILSRL